MAQDHNDIYSIVERLRILEEGLDKNQRSVNQLSATFKPKTVAVLTAKKDPKNPLAGKLVGGAEESVERDEESLAEAVANEDVLDKVKASFADYLKTVADEIKQDSDIKEKSKVDHDLGKKDKTDRDLIAKEKKETVDEAELDEDRLSVGDPVVVVGANEFEGKTGEITEFSPSGKFVVVNLYNHGEHSMHLSDIKYNEYADDEDDFDPSEQQGFKDQVDEDPTTDDETIEPPQEPIENPVMPESAAVKTVTNECGLWEIHGNEPAGFEIRLGNRPMKSRFKSIDEAEMALEMFAARRRKADESADYIEEA